MILSLTWYFQSKNLALKNALSFRCPLAVGQQTELRHYYGSYFASLVSATELLLEKEYPHNVEFKDAIERALWSGSLTDGERYYGYVRELRNAIVHRGLDVCAAAHIDGDFPLPVAPQTVQNRSGNKSYAAPAFYLHDIILMWESILGPVIEHHLDEVGLLRPQNTQERAVAADIEHIAESVVMPEWVKEFSLKTVGLLDYVELQRTQISNFVDLLRFNAAADILLRTSHEAAP
jgi:hypothetical protein